MSERDYYNRMRKDLHVLKREVLSFDAQKRKECGYLPISISKSMSHTGRPLSKDEFIGRIHEVVATTLWLQSILDKLNGLTSSCAIEMIKLTPYPHPSQFKEQRGRKPLGKKTQERLLQKGFSAEQGRTGTGMRSWIKSSQRVSGELAEMARQMLNDGEVFQLLHFDEDGKVTSELDPKKQRAYLDGPEVMANHAEESLLRALARGKQKFKK